MKKLAIFVSSLILAASVCMAESYVVYSVHGNVTEATAYGRAAINARDTHLTDDSRIAIGRGGALTLYLNDARTLVSIDEQGMQRLSTLVARSRHKSKPSASWVKAMLNSLMRSQAPEYTHRQVLQSQGASHRDDEHPRALANAFARWLAGQSAGDNAVLTLQFVDSDGNVIDSPISQWDGEAVARVTNRSNNYLFVNLVAVDAGGTRSLVFPVDTDIENNCCAHLLVPPSSSIDLVELGFFPSDYEGVDRYILVGSERQVNFTGLCDDRAYDPAVPVAKILIAE